MSATTHQNLIAARAIYAANPGAGSGYSTLTGAHCALGSIARVLGTLEDLWGDGSRGPGDARYADEAIELARALGGNPGARVFFEIANPNDDQPCDSEHRITDPSLMLAAFDRAIAATAPAEGVDSGAPQAREDREPEKCEARSRSGYGPAWADARNPMRVGGGAA